MYITMFYIQLYRILVWKHTLNVDVQHCSTQIVFGFDIVYQLFFSMSTRYDTVQSCLTPTTYIVILNHL